MPIYELRGVEVKFPYEAYPCQLDYMSRVIEALQDKKNALLESPTGTGKTLCLLCASLAWREALQRAAAAAPDQIRAQQPHSSTLVQGLKESYAELKAERAAKGDGLPTIIYSSRTHSQLKQVMKELSTTAYTPRVSVLGSRQQSCLHPTVQQLPAAAANQACRALTSKRACKWGYNVERFMKANPDANSTVLDIEDLSKLGASHTLCPYFLSRDMAATADIIFMPYNYLTDVKTRGGLGISWDDAILIFDEAHNVESVCSDAASFDLPAPLLAGAIEEVGTAAELAMTKAETSRGNIADQFGKMDDGTSWLSAATEMRQLQMVLKKLEQEVAQVKLNGDRGFTAPGQFLFDLFTKLNLTSATWPQLSYIMETATSMLSADAVEGGRRQGSRSSSYRLHTLHEALSLAFTTLEPPRTGAKPSHSFYRVHIHLEQQRGSDRKLPTLGYWCFSPGLAMAALADMNIRSILLTSGTLSPLTSFAQELTVPFAIRLENPHVIDPSQVWVAVVGKGPRGFPLNSSFQTRNSPEYKEDLGNAIVNFARIVPDGLLVFFPSYGVMKQCTDAWKSPGVAGGTSVWERIGQYKAAVVEPRETAMFPAATADFQAKLDNPAYKGAVFFAVCRGKASEGLDFSDRAGRAVIITGIPYATKTDPKVQLKQEVLNEARRTRQLAKKRPYQNNSNNNYNSGGGGGSSSAAAGDEDELLSGDTWYVQQAIRAVNQAMGRVIRHRRDYGAIILCDERFKQEGVLRQLSKWLRDKVQQPQSFGAASGSLTKFFKAQAEATRQGLVGDNGARTISTRAGVPTTGLVESFNGGGGGGGSGAMGAFQIATRTQLGGNSQSLLRSVPAAADMAGLGALMAGVVTAAGAGTNTAAGFSGGGGGGGGLDEIVMGLGTINNSATTTNTTTNGGGGGGGARLRPPSSSFPAQQAQQIRGGGGGGGGGGDGLRPWERAAADASLRSSSVRPSVLGSGGGGGGGTGKDPSSHTVGPAHRLQKHAAQQQQQEQNTVQPPRVSQPASIKTTTLRPLPPPLERLPALPPPPPPPLSTTTASQRDSVRPSKPDVQQQQQQQQVVINSSKPVNAATAAGGAKEGQDILSRLRNELPSESSQRLLTALRNYKINREPAPLLCVAASELHKPSQRSLLAGFREFVPKKLHGAFDVQLQKAATASAALYGEQKRPPPLSQPPVPVKSVKNSVLRKNPGLQSSSGVAKVPFGGANSEIKKKVENEGMVSAAVRPSAGKARMEAAAAKAASQPCSICNKIPCVSPHHSTCCRDFIGCYTCWLTHVALRVCPGCKRAIKKSMLVKKYF